MFFFENTTPREVIRGVAKKGVKIMTHDKHRRKERRYKSVFCLFIYGLMISHAYDH